MQIEIFLFLFMSEWWLPFTFKSYRQHFYMLKCNHRSPLTSTCSATEMWATPGTCPQGGKHAPVLITAQTNKPVLHSSSNIAIATWEAELVIYSCAAFPHVSLTPTEQGVLHLGHNGWFDLKRSNYPQQWSVWLFTDGGRVLFKQNWR